MPPLCASPAVAVAVAVAVPPPTDSSPPNNKIRSCGYAYNPLGSSVSPGDGSLPVSSSLYSSPDGAWTVTHSTALYRVDGWGAPYFTINDNGNVAVRPHGPATSPSQEIDLTKVVKKIVSAKTSGGLGMRAPFIVRFPDVLRHRLQSLQAAFDSAIALCSYESHYQGVYPVKCNQDRFVVENIVDVGAEYDFGLEAGSKPELLLAMSYMCRASPRALLVCNGYKDDEYITLALTARRLGLNCVIVLEQEEELELILDAAVRLDVEPVIGLRAKLRTKHAGHFGGTSGEKGKFGLTSTEIVNVVRKLKRLGMAQRLQFLHFHIGSQIPSLEVLNDGVTEAAFIYCELTKMGADMKVIDIGGGLGIDYNGTRSASCDMSVAYSLEEYALAVVQAVQSACYQKGVKCPVICSESGRALVSHHSVLIFDVVSIRDGLPGAGLGDLVAETDMPAELVDQYNTVLGYAGLGEYKESKMCAEHMKARCIDLFKEGALGLEQLALIDGICDLLDGKRASSVCQINLSIFKSLPDCWAIGQKFPMMPIQRLNERPTVRAVLSDLTCDSDGKLAEFIDGEEGLAMHRQNKTEAYYIGMFLGGAYQEALGGLHNLFGTPSVVHVVESGGGPHCFAVTRALPGQTAADVLRVMMHEPPVMFERLKSRVEDSLLYRHNDSDEAYESALSSLRSIAAAFDSQPYLSSASCSSDESEDDLNLDLLW